EVLQRPAPQVIEAVIAKDLARAACFIRTLGYTCASIVLIVERLERDAALGTHDAIEPATLRVIDLFRRHTIAKCPAGHLPSCVRRFEPPKRRSGSNLPYRLQGSVIRIIPILHLELGSTLRRVVESIEPPVRVVAVRVRHDLPDDLGPAERDSTELVV